MKVILVSGKARSGKDTAAIMMCKELKNRGHRVLITHFADLLKHICRSFFGWEGTKDEEGRTLLQYVGTDVIRKKNPDMWVDFIVRMLDYFPDEWDFVIIPDCRFPNEITGVANAGHDVTCLRIIRSESDEMTEEQKLHPSEMALDGYIPDYSIVNDGTLEELEEKIKCFTEEVLYGGNE